MVEQLRAKGQYVQAATLVCIPLNKTVDGVVDFDTVYLQADYPVLFQIIGTDYNQAGDDDATEMRTPPAPEFTRAFTDAEWVFKMRY